MTVGRNKVAKSIYLTSGKAKRKEMVSFALCDDQSGIGLMRDYNASDFKSLARIRKSPAHTRAERFKRRSDFYHALHRIANRDGKDNPWINL